MCNAAVLCSDDEFKKVEEYAKSKGLAIIKRYTDERQLIDDFRSSPDSYKGYNILLVHGNSIFYFLIHSGVVEVTWDPPSFRLPYCDVSIEYLNKI